MPAVLAPLFLFALRRYGLVTGRSAGYEGKEVEGGRHVLGSAVLVVRTIAGMSVPLGCARMLLLPGGMFHSGGGLRQVNAFLPGEKVVEHACGKLLAQTGAVEDGFGGMVDEGRPIDAPGFILTEYHADSLPHEFPLELRPVMPCGLHGGCNLSGGGGGDLLVGLFPCGSVVHPPFEGSDARLLAEHGGLEGLADLVALPVSCRIGQAVILPPAVFPLYLVHRDAVKGKHGTVFAQCTETPLPASGRMTPANCPLRLPSP